MQLLMSNSFIANFLLKYPFLILLIIIVLAILMIASPFYHINLIILRYHIYIFIINLNFSKAFLLISYYQFLFLKDLTIIIYFYSDNLET